MRYDDERMRLLGIAMVCAGGLGFAGLAAADEPIQVTAATASSTTAQAHSVSHLFDLDEATTWCAREKAKATVGVKLSGTITIDAAHLALGDFSDWKAGPRIKQVFVTVLDGDKTVKKVRHKWPDGEDPREGKVNLGAPGDGVLIEFDLSYAGSGSGGLCVSGVRLESAGATVDTTPIAAEAWGERAINDRFPGDYTVLRNTPDGDAAAARLEVKKRGKFEYRDSGIDLKVEGKWKLQGTELVFDVTKAKANDKRIPYPKEPIPVSLRFQVPDGGAPSFVPWIAFVRDETGALVAEPPKAVLPP
jgi:hypothetical protein